LHGQQLEDHSDPTLDAAVARWTDAQNAYARSVLEALPGRAAVSAELEALLSLDSSIARS